MPDVAILSFLYMGAMRTEGTMGLELTCRAGSGPVPMSFEAHQGGGTVGVVRCDDVR